MNPYELFKEKLNKIAAVDGSIQLLEWDRETYMPQDAAGREEQLAVLEVMVHGLRTDPELKTLVDKLCIDNNLSKTQKLNVLRTKEENEKEAKKSPEFVEQLSRAQSEGDRKWKQAREKNDFNIFLPALEKLIEIRREECELLGYKGHPLNALIDDQERGWTCEKIETIFSQFKKEGKKLSDKIQERIVKEKWDSSNP